MTVGAAVETDANQPIVDRVTVGRTVRPIMHGSVYYRYIDGLEPLKDD